MIPKSLSASSLLVFEACPARWKTEYFDKVRTPSGDAANNGSAVHGALEMFVVKFKAGEISWNLKDLLAFYQMSYMQVFSTANTDTDLFAEGVAMLKDWFKRSDFLKETNVLSCEVKENFELKTSAGIIPLNFIFDRLDQLNETTYKVVDYKTIRMPLTPEQLKTRIQPRIYALATQIKFPHATKIWVEYDLLRYTAVGCVFTKEDNAVTYRYLQKAAERIIQTDGANPPEQLNPDCRWCLRKARCKTLMTAMLGGTTYSVTPAEAAERRLEITSAIAALNQLDAELDTILLAQAENEDMLEWDVNGVHVEITASKRRNVLDNREIAELLPPSVAAKYSGFTIGNIDQLMKGDEIDDETKAKIKKLIGIKWGEPRSKVTPVHPFSEDE